MDLYKLGVIISFLGYTYTALTYNKHHDKAKWLFETPLIFQMLTSNLIVDLALNFLVFVGYGIILFSSWEILRNVLTVIVLYALIFPIYGGLIFGIPQGIKARKIMKEINEKP